MTERIVLNVTKAHFDSKLATTVIVGTEGSLAAKDSCPLVASFGTLWWQKEMQSSYRCSFSSKTALLLLSYQNAQRDKLLDWLFLLCVLAFIEINFKML